MSTSANEKADQSGRKNVKSEIYIFFHRQGAQLVLKFIVWTLDATRTLLELTKYSFRIIDVPGCNYVADFTERISFPEHWKLVADSSEFHLTLSRAHFFQLQIRIKKRDILSEKRESGMALKKREFTPESGNVDTYEFSVRTCKSFLEQSTHCLEADVNIETENYPPYVLCTDIDFTRHSMCTFTVHSMCNIYCKHESGYLRKNLNFLNSWKGCW